EAEDHQIREVIVYAEGYNSDGSGDLTEATEFETISYEGIPTEALALARAAFDMRSARHRSRIVRCEQDVEWLEIRPGDLRLIETDIIGKIGGRGRVKQIVVESGDVTAIVFDELRDFALADSLSADRGVAFRLLDGSVMVHAVTTDDDD